MATAGAAKRAAEKNKTMAAYMKANGIIRSTMRCPIGNHIVSIRTFGTHLMNCR